MQTIAVIDYGMGNLRSVAKAVEHVAGRDTRVLVTSDVKAISDAHRIIFPGQGAAKECMRALEQHELTEGLLDASVRNSSVANQAGANQAQLAADRRGSGGLLGGLVSSLGGLFS